MHVLTKKIDIPLEIDAQKDTANSEEPKDGESTIGNKTLRNYNLVRNFLQERSIRMEDLEPFYTAIEKVREAQGNEYLAHEAENLYHQFSVNLALGEEIKALTKKWYVCESQKLIFC